MDVLVVEDDAMVRQLLERELRAKGHVPTAVGTGAAAVTLLDEHRYDALILDLTLPDMDGIDLA
jgi:DNA-binding response OmpR family regulator